MCPFDSLLFRKQFPALSQLGTYLDSASSAVKCRAMIEAIQNYYTQTGVNIERGHYAAAQQTGQTISEARQIVADFIHAPSSQQLIWTSGATQSLNMVARSYLAPRLQSGDEIIVSVMEHHSNLLPWIMVAQSCGARIIPWTLNERNELDIDTLTSLISNKTRMVAVTQMSNVTGYQPPLATVTQLLHSHNIPITVDGAQGIVHHPPDLSDLPIDFYAFSAHKLYSAMGCGLLYINESHLDAMYPYQGGGKMLINTTMHNFTAAALPARLEAGTQNLPGMIGLAATLKWLQLFDQTSISNYMLQLAQHTYQELLTLPNIIIYSYSGSPIISFNFSGHHPHDIATLLAEQNIALRQGEHCAQPLMTALGINGCLRISLAPYTSYEDIQHVMRGLHSALTLLE